MRHVKFAGLVAALAVAALVGRADARAGGIGTGRIFFAGSTDFIDSNTTSASDYTGGGTIRRNTLAVGTVITIEAWGNCSTTGTPNLTIGVVLGNTQMISSGTQQMGNGITDNPFYVKAVGHVRVAGASGLIQWSLYVFYDQATDIVRQFTDTSPDSLDTTIDNQDLGLRFTWGTVSASNTLTVSEMVMTIQ